MEKATNMEVIRLLFAVTLVVVSSSVTRMGAFTSSGKYVITVSNDKTAWLWYTDYHDTLTYLCSLLSRDLTPEEREQYNITDRRPTCH